MKQRFMVYRIIVLVLALISVMVSVSAFFGNSINIFYFPNNPKLISEWEIFGFAGLGLFLGLEGFAAVLPKFMKRKSLIK